MNSIPNTVSRVKLLQLSKLATAPKWQYETLRASREPILLWVTQGQGRINLGGQVRGFHPHNLIFIPAGAMHGFQSLLRVQGTIVYFGQNHGLDLPDRPVHLRLRESNQQIEVSQIIDALQREIDSRRPRSDRAAQLHLGMLALWLDRHLEETPADPARTSPEMNANERLTARYAALLEREFGSALNVTDYAMALGVTPTHLTRACRSSCGRTALELLTERRLFEARRLLAETQTPVQDIARALGYSSAGYFTRNFTQGTGLAPSAYRKSAGQTGRASR